LKRKKLKFSAHASGNLLAALDDEGAAVVSVDDDVAAAEERIVRPRADEDWLCSGVVVGEDGFFWSARFC